MSDADERMADGIRGELSHALFRKPVIWRHEQEWFWKKVVSFAREGNPDPIGNVVKEFQLWPSKSNDDSTKDTVESRPPAPGERNSEVSQGLRHVLSAVRNFTGPSVTLKEASFSTYVKTGPRWHLRFDVTTYVGQEDADLDYFISNLRVFIPDALVMYTQLHNVGGLFWAVDMEVPV